MPAAILSRAEAFHRLMRDSQHPKAAIALSFTSSLASSLQDRDHYIIILGRKILEEKLVI